MGFSRLNPAFSQTTFVAIFLTNAIAPLAAIFGTVKSLLIPQFNAHLLRSTVCPTYLAEICAFIEIELTHK